MNFRWDVVTFALLWPAGLWAQLIPGAKVTGPPTPPATPAASNAPAPTPGPQSYRPDQIFGQVEESERALRAIASRSEDTPKLKEIQESLPAFTTAVNTLVRYTEDILSREPSLGDLKDLQNTWRVTLDRLSGWQTSLQTASAQLEQDVADLRLRAASWRKTLDEAGSNELPPGIVAQVKKIVDSVEAARQQSLGQRNKILGIRNQVSLLQVQVDATLDKLNNAMDQRRADVLQKDSSPVWESRRSTTLPQGPASREPINGAGMAGFAQYMQMAFFKGFLKFMGVYVLFLIPMLLLRRRGVLWLKNQDPAVQRLGRIVRRPYSVAILLTIPAATILTGPLPEFVANFLSLVLLIPLIRIVPLIVSPQLKVSIYLLGVLYGLERIAGFVPQFSTSGRWLLLALTVATAIAFGWQYRRLRAEHLKLISYGFLRFLLRLTIALALLSAVLNVIGYVSLSQSITGGVVKSLYAAVLIHSIAMIAHSFATLILRPIQLRLKDQPDSRLTKLHSRVKAGITFLSLVLLAVVVLHNFGLLTPLLKWLGTVLTAPLNIGAIHLTLEEIVTFALALGAAFIFSDVLRVFLDMVVFPRVQMQAGSARAVSQLLNYGVLLLGFLIASSAAGLDMSKFAFLAGALGVGVGFGLQNIVNNFVSGLILLFERPVHVGDRVTIRGGVNGIVNNIGIRASTIRTWDGADVVVPNGDLLANDLTNWTLSDTRRRGELVVGVAYGSDAAKVIEMLTATARAHPKVDRFPEPIALFTGFGDSSLNFVLRFWAHTDDWAVVTSDVHIAVNRAFCEAGIEIPFPQRDIHIRSKADGA